MQFLSISASFFLDIGKLTLKFIWKEHGPRISKAILKQKNKVGGITTPHVKTYWYRGSNQDRVVLAEGQTHR